MKRAPLVGVVMGSRSDYDVLQPAIEILNEFSVAHEARVVSAHRTPDWLFEYAATAEARGLRVLIAGAGGAAHLPGMLAAKTHLPVLGVPIPATMLAGVDSLLSIVQMPKGVPVGTLAIGKPGAANAALLAISILALNDSGLRDRLCAWRESRRDEVLAQELPSPEMAPAPKESIAEVSGNDVILPGATIGILGGGQLGRMMAMAARSLGYRIQVLDPDPSCPARFVVDACFEAGWNDARAAADLARGCDVVTLEIEQISIAALEAAERYAPVRPGSRMLAIIQDRIRQKDWLAAHRIPVGEYRAACDAAQLKSAVRDLGGRCFIKSARGGYDGRSQEKIGFDGAAHDAAVTAAWESLGQQPVAVEKALDLALEISVLVARSPRGEIKAYPPAVNHHERQILAWSAIPANVPASMAAQAREMAVAIAENFQLEGLLAVEMFVTTDGRLLVNELAPRPHNSYHASERACSTSQFEQAVRAVCNLPLGEVEVIQPAAIANLLGDLWLDAAAETGPRFDRALAIPGVRLHLYEKHLPRRNRKMGHLSAVGATAEDAVASVLEAKAQL